MPNKDRPLERAITDPSLNIVLCTPLIPNNTGNIGRTCLAIGARLHLIHPLGFQIDDKHLKRAGMDYWQHIDLVEHPSWEAYLETCAPERLWLFTTKTDRSFREATWRRGDHLLFGPEDRGVSETIHDQLETRYGAECRVRIPMVNDPAARSLNLSTSVAIASYEALRSIQGGF